MSTVLYDDPGVVGLVIAAREGDRGAWDRIVERYAPLVWGICVRFRLDREDADDVGQAVWRSLVRHLQTTEAPAALPGWLARTTRDECLRRQRVNVEVEQELETSRRHIALREAFANLRPHCQEPLSCPECLAELRRSPALAALAEAERPEIG